MNANLLQLEIHANALQENRMQRILLAQQLQDANIQDIHPARRMTQAIRFAIGNTLLAAGERIAGKNEERAVRIEAARRAPKTA